jgi:Reverse transcriptase-like
VDTRSASTGRGSARDLAFRRAGRRSPRLLHIYITTAARRYGAPPSVVFVDDAGRVLETVPLDRIPETRSQPALRGIVHALWKARRLGYRRVELHTDDPAAVAQMNGERAVDPDGIGLYLEAKALMHLYTIARIDIGESLLSAHDAPAPRPRGADLALS